MCSLGEETLFQSQKCHIQKGYLDDKIAAEAKSREDANRQLPEESLFSRLPFEAEV